MMRSRSLEVSIVEHFRVSCVKFLSKLCARYKHHYYQVLNALCSNGLESFSVDVFSGQERRVDWWCGFDLRRRIWRAD